MPAMNGLLALNYGLRGAAAALLVLISVAIWREARQALAGRLGAAFALSACAYALYFSPGLALPSALWHLPLALLAQGAAVLFWLTVSALFDDDFQLRFWHGLIWLAVGLLGFVQFYVLIPSASPYRGLVGTVLDVQPVLFAALGIWRVVSNWKLDLIELRRRFRGVILVATVLNIVLVALTKLAASQDGQGAGVSMVEAAAVCAAAFWVMWRLLNQGLADWVVQQAPEAAALVVPNLAELPPSVQTAVDHESAAPVVQGKSPPVDPSLLAALELKMTQAQIYREEDLSIGSLAQNLGVQEYQLRRLINQGLGYRNFNAFVNHYRLADAQALLADPAKRHVAVLNIAMDCGFGSLGPFNRAFKAQTGMTPTEFRKANLPD